MVASDDPLTRALAPLPDETSEERQARLRAEQAAKQTSDNIDSWLAKDKKKHFVKVLLLGQAESDDGLLILQLLGKSTTLKNMKLVYAADSFRKERASWRVIIHFNILRQVVTMVHALEQALSEEGETRPSTSSDNLAPPQERFSTDHRVLCMRLKPLLEVESNLTKHLSQSLQRRQGEEVAVHAQFAWSKYFHRPDAATNAHTSVGDALKREVSCVLDASCTNILRLWNDPIVRRLLHAHGIRLDLEAGFFLDDLERVTAPNYEPSDLDVLKARLKTVGVTETPLKVRSHIGSPDWIVYDVGGSRTQRASWKPFFDDVHAIVFLAPLSAFNQTLEEMPSVNRLEDSLLLWRDISSSPLLANAHLILFLNKVDLLRKKLKQGVEFRSFLSGYTGANEVDTVCKYMRKKFLAVNKDAQEKLKASNGALRRVVRVWFTSTLDLDDTRRTIIEIENSILGDNLANSSIV